jgi:hypothetical protein
MFPTFSVKKKKKSNHRRPTTAMRAVLVSCPKINHNHLDPTLAYKETVRDLRFSLRWRWRFKTPGGMPDSKHKGAIILRKVRNYLPIDKELASKMTLQFQSNHLSFIMDNISGSRSNSQIPLLSEIHYDAAVRFPLLICRPAPFFVFAVWSNWHTLSQNSNQLIFVGTFYAGICVICLLLLVQDSNHKWIQTE